jgi:hypothetical protein
LTRVNTPVCNKVVATRRGSHAKSEFFRRESRWSLWAGVTEGGFTGVIDDRDEFRTSLTALGDLDGDGVTDLAVGASRDDDGEEDAGAVWVLFLNPDGTVKRHQKISDQAGGLEGMLTGLRYPNPLELGLAVASMGDIDGVGDLAVGQRGGFPEGDGAVWMRFLNADGTVKSKQWLSPFQWGGGGFGGLSQHVVGLLGKSVSALGDLDGDGVLDGAAGDPEPRRGGAVLILFGDGAPAPLCGPAPLTGCRAAVQARLRMADHYLDDRHRLSWTWRGPGPAVTDFGDPTRTTKYALCMWDHQGGTPVHVGNLEIPPGFRWEIARPGKLRYRDKYSDFDGVHRVILKQSSGYKASLAVKARRRRLPLPVPVSPTRFLTEDPRITVQLVISDGFCWSSDFVASRRNDAFKFIGVDPCPSCTE